MINELRIQNFRCFENHLIPFHPNTTIIVGRNNAGKSTIVEALRLVSIIVTRYQSLNYHDVPDWLDLPKRMRGVSPDIGGMEFNLESTFYQYAGPPAIITASFNNGTSVSIYLGLQNGIHAVVSNTHGSPIKSRAEAYRCSLPRVSIMPQVAPVARNEPLLTAEYVRRAMSSPLAPLHFRNQLKILYELFPSFQQTAEETWPGLRILELAGGRGIHAEPLTLLVRNEGFVADIASMGHGLQMWLQTMWFLTRSQSDPTIILDEPDVYMHADLQRRLIRFLRNQDRQVIVTTHSVEIMAEVDADEILIIDRTRPGSRFATSLPAVQRLVEHIGSVHNVHLARLWGAHRCIFVEGKDIKLLKQFQDKMFPDATESFDAIPNMPIGGWGGWKYAIGSSMLLRNAGGESITIYCILDRDYHTEEEINRRLLEAKKRGVQLHIWTSKEIESYVLVPEAIYRVIKSRIARRTSAPSIEEITAQIDRITENRKDEVFDALSTELLAQDKPRGPRGANQAARQIINARWTTLKGRMSLVSGKEILSRLSEWSQQEFAVALNAKLLARNIKVEEIPEEIANVVAAIENSVSFTSMGITGH